MSKYIGFYALFKRFRRTSAINRKAEERLYKYIFQEIKAGDIRDGLMTKAEVIAKGNKDQIKAEYIKLRIQSIQDEFVIEDFLKEIEENIYRSEQEIRKMMEEQKNKSEDEESFDSGAAVTFWFLLIIGALLAITVSLS